MLILEQVAVLIALQVQVEQAHIVQVQIAVIKQLILSKI
jgi:hypothetical protein